MVIENYKPLISPLGGRQGTYFLDRITLNDVIFKPSRPKGHFDTKTVKLCSIILSKNYHEC